MTVQPNNKSTKKIAEKSILLAVIAIIESLLLLVSFSFAWFYSQVFFQNSAGTAARRRIDHGRIHRYVSLPELRGTTRV